MSASRSRRSRDDPQHGEADDEDSSSLSPASRMLAIADKIAEEEIRADAGSRGSDTGTSTSEGSDDSIGPGSKLKRLGRSIDTLEGVDERALRRGYVQERRGRHKQSSARRLTNPLGLPSPAASQSSSNESWRQPLREACPSNSPKEAMADAVDGPEQEGRAGDAEANVDGLTVAALKAKAAELGIPTTGRKHDLKERVKANLAATVRGNGTAREALATGRITTKTSVGCEDDYSAAPGRATQSREARRDLHETRRPSGCHANSEEALLDELADLSETMAAGGSAEVSSCASPLSAAVAGDPSSAASAEGTQADVDCDTPKEEEHTSGTPAQLFSGTDTASDTGVQAQSERVDALTVQESRTKGGFHTREACKHAAEPRLQDDMDSTSASVSCLTGVTKAAAEADRTAGGGVVLGQGATQAHVTRPAQTDTPSPHTETPRDSCVVGDDRSPEDRNDKILSSKEKKELEGGTARDVTSGEGEGESDFWREAAAASAGDVVSISRDETEVPTSPGVENASFTVKLRSESIRTEDLSLSFGGSDDGVLRSACIRASDSSGIEGMPAPSSQRKDAAGLVESPEKALTGEGEVVPSAKELAEKYSHLLSLWAKILRGRSTDEDTNLFPQASKLLPETVAFKENIATLAACLQSGSVGSSAAVARAPMPGERAKGASAKKPNGDNEGSKGAAALGPVVSSGSLWDHKAGADTAGTEVLPPSAGLTSRPSGAAGTSAAAPTAPKRKSSGTAPATASAAALRRARAGGGVAAQGRKMMSRNDGGVEKRAANRRSGTGAFPSGPRVSLSPPRPRPPDGGIVAASTVAGAGPGKYVANGRRTSGAANLPLPKRANPLMRGVSPPRPPRLSARLSSGPRAAPAAAASKPGTSIGQKEPTEATASKGRRLVPGPRINYLASQRNAPAGAASGKPARDTERQRGTSSKTQGPVGRRSSVSKAPPRLTKATASRLPAANTGARSAVSRARRRSSVQESAGATKAGRKRGLRVFGIETSSPSPPRDNEGQTEKDSV